MQTDRDCGLNDSIGPHFLFVCSPKLKSNVVKMLQALVVLGIERFCVVMESSTDAKKNAECMRTIFQHGTMNLGQTRPIKDSH